MKLDFTKEEKDVIRTSIQFSQRALRLNRKNRRYLGRLHSKFLPESTVISLGRKDYLFLANILVLHTGMVEKAFIEPTLDDEDRYEELTKVHGFLYEAIERIENATTKSNTCESK